MDQCKSIWKTINQVNQFDNDHSNEKAVVLVGTQLDLLYNTVADDKDTEMMRSNQKEAIKLSEKWNVPYIEVSARNNVNINLLFEYVVREYWIQTQGMILNWIIDWSYVDT